MKQSMVFNAGLDIHWNEADSCFEYGKDVFGPATEHRHLDDIRRSLLDPDCSGPDPVYSIAMDVGRLIDQTELKRHMLLFGVVTYACGRLGREPVRSQGHVHSISPHSGWSAPELFEIWQGKAIVYAQQHIADEPGNCVAIEAGVGDQVVIPPGWAHYVVNPDPRCPMTFAAWCDRQYGFEYDAIRQRGGLAWFPLLDEQNLLYWKANPAYNSATLNHRNARSYSELGITSECPAYERFIRAPDSLRWISEPSLHSDVWPSFVP